MEIWFTADHHFGHARIIELAARPFASVEAMDELMIEKWNARVAPGDLVYHVGDFAFVDHIPYLSRLKGQKRLIVGNHDHSNRVKKAVGWATVDSMLNNHGRQNTDRAVPLRPPCMEQIALWRAPFLRAQPWQLARRHAERRRGCRLLGFPAGYAYGDY